MALLTLECPICEFIFEAEVGKNKQACCSYCSHLFVPHPSTKVAGRASNRQLQTSPSPINSSIKQSKSAGEPIRKADQLHSSILLKRMKARRRNNLTLLLLLVGTIVSIALVRYRYWDIEQQSKLRRANLELNFSNSDTPAAGPPAPQPLPPAIDQKTVESATKRPAKPVTTQAPPPKFQYLSSSVADDRAALMKPYLVLLEIESPTGITYATGTIVDSRGYVVTSLPAVTGASNITVSSAQTVAQLKKGVQAPLSDKVRGVIAVSKSQQWALLEINRRLVLNASDVSIPPTDRIVSLQPLFRIIAPSTPLDFSVSETRVDVRKPSSELQALQKTLLNVTQGQEDINWILCPFSPYDRLGAALVSPEGKLMAVLVNHDDQFSYFIGANKIAERLNSGNLTPRSLDSLQ